MDKKKLIKQIVRASFKAKDEIEKQAKNLQDYIKESDLPQKVDTTVSYISDKVTNKFRKTILDDFYFNYYQFINNPTFNNEAKLRLLGITQEIKENIEDRKYSELEPLIFAQISKSLNMGLDEELLLLTVISKKAPYSPIDYVVKYLTKNEVSFDYLASKVKTTKEKLFSFLTGDDVDFSQEEELYLEIGYVEEVAMKQILEDKELEEVVKDKIDKVKNFFTTTADEFKETITAAKEEYLQEKNKNEEQIGDVPQDGTLVAIPFETKYKGFNSDGSITRTIVEGKEGFGIYIDGELNVIEPPITEIIEYVPKTQQTILDVFEKLSKEKQDTNSIDDSYVEIPIEIKRALQKKYIEDNLNGMTIAKLNEAIGSSNQSIFTSGTLPLSINRAHDIAKTLNLDAGVLYTGDENAKNSKNPRTRLDYYAAKAGERPTDLIQMFDEVSSYKARSIYNSDDLLEDFLKRNQLEEKLDF